MPNEDVRFLNACGVVGLHDKQMVHEVFELTAVFAQETDCYKTVGFSRFNRLEKIGAIARCRDRDETSPSCPSVRPGD